MKLFPLVANKWLKLHFIGWSSPSVVLFLFWTGKKNGDLDRNFDTLDLPKRSETAKGNAHVCAFGNDKQRESWRLLKGFET